MKNKLLLKLTLKGMKSRKQVLFPYFISTILLFAFEYVMISLIGNNFVQTRHKTLPIMMIFSAIISGIFIMIFTIYSNKFSRKRQYKEFGLYSALGLEKKHLGKMMNIETLINFIIIAPISIFTGYLFGIVSFMFINKLMKDTGATIIEYPFSINGAIITILFILFTLILSRIMAEFKIRKLNIKEIFQSSKNNEGEPKSKIIITIIGLILLSIGYYISLTTKDPITGVINLLIATVLVIFATYFLFVGLSIVVLKLLKKNKKFYYKASNFLSISGMIYRMKSNAISLASISILCTGLIITIGTTASVYFSLNDKISSIISKDYSIDNLSETEFNKIYNDLKNNFTEEKISKTLEVPALFKNNKLDFLKDSRKQEVKFSEIVYSIIEPLSSYNGYQKNKIKLKENEILIVTNIRDFDYRKKIKFKGKEYNVKKLDEDYKLIPFATKALYIVGNDKLTNEIREYFKTYNSKDNKYYYQPYKYEIQFNLNPKVKDKVEKSISEKYGLSYETPESIKREYYSINGGFLSLGIMISIIMIIGTSLMLYYKQISEGYSDREKFKIMKQVGLENGMIKSTIKKQVIWIFFLPIVIGIIHTTFAFSLLSKLLEMFGMRDLLQLVAIYGVVSLVCLCLYGLFYKITSKTYYNLVR